MAEKRYSKNGEWAKAEGDLWKMGLTAQAVGDLGGVTFVELPPLGRSVAAGEAACAVEAVKAAADFYSPLGGTVALVNNTLGTDPTFLNSSPEDQGWIFALTGVPASDIDALMDEKAWRVWVGSL